MAKGYDFDNTIYLEDGTFGIIPDKDGVIITGNTQDTEAELRSILAKIDRQDIPIYFFPDKKILEADPDHIQELVGKFKANKIGELGIKNFYEDNKIQAEIITSQNPQVNLVLVNFQPSKPQQQIKKLVAFTYSGEEAPIVEHAIDEGVDAVLAMIEDKNDTLLPEEEKKAEKPEIKERRLSIHKGIVPVVSANEAVKNLKKLSDEEKKETFVFFGMNHGFKFSEQIDDLNIPGHYTCTEDREFEVKREKTKEFVKKNYLGVEVQEYHKFRTIDEGIKFLEETQDCWVLKSESDDGDTVVPNKNDPEKAKKQIINALKEGKKDYEKAGFILEKYIHNPIELTPEIVLLEGKPIYYSLDIELKKKGAGETGGQSGCAANLVIPLDPSDPIVKIAFPPVIEEMAKKAGGLMIWDISLLIDPKDGKIYVGEYCPRFGFDSTFTEMEMAGGVSNFFNALLNGQNPFPKDIKGFALRLFNEHPDKKVPALAEAGLNIDIDPASKSHIWKLDAKKKGDGFETIGFGSDLLVITSTGKSFKEAVDKAFEILEKDVSFGEVDYRYKEDIMSLFYPTSILNRYYYGRENNLFMSQDDFDDEYFKLKSKLPIMEDDKVLDSLAELIKSLVVQTASRHLQENRKEYESKITDLKRKHIKELKSLEME